MNTKFKGNIAENQACKFLKHRNFKIVERNFYCKGGEIDIIAFKDNTFHFIEVKSGKNFNPIYNVTPKKIKRIIKCIYSYLNKNKISSAFCLDVVIVKNDSIEIIENITL